MKLELVEIPNPVNMAGWKQVPIKECGEPLIELNRLDAMAYINSPCKLKFHVL